MSFKQWFKQNEVATTVAGGGGGTLSSNIAPYKMPIGGMVVRGDLGTDKKKKKKKKKNGGVLEMFPGKKVVMGDIGYF